MKRITKIEAAADSSRKKLRVAAYARVSTDNEEQLISLEAQKNHYERYIKARPNWEYAGLYYDEGVTGTSMAKREGLLQMLDDCDQGLIDYIIVKSISRFSRNTLESIETVRKLAEKGIYLYFEKENIDTGKMEGELLLSILSSLAESESHSISENYRWSLKKRLENGTVVIGYPPYGYDNENGKMVVNKEQAEIVQWIYKSVLDGKSPGTIAKELNSQGIQTKRGSKWNRHTIISMVRNEKYKGDVLFQKSYTDDRFNRHKNFDEREKYYIKDHHEAIISHEDFDAANAIIELDAIEKGIKKSEEKYKRRYVTSGKIICGECGATWRRNIINGYPGYACQTHVKDKTACHMKSIPEEAIKMAFVTMMNKMVFARNELLIPYSVMLRHGHTKARLEQREKVDSLLQMNMQRRKQLLQLISKGLLDPPIFQEQNDILKREEEKLLEEKRAMTADADRVRRENLAELIQYAAKGEMITEFDDDLFIKFVDHIVVCSRTEIGFVMKCGPVFRERIEWNEAYTNGI